MRGLKLALIALCMGIGATLGGCSSTATESFTANERLNCLDAAKEISVMCHDALDMEPAELHDRFDAIRGKQVAAAKAFKEKYQATPIDSELGLVGPVTRLAGREDGAMGHFMETTLDGVEYMNQEEFALEKKEAEKALAVLDDRIELCSIQKP